MKKLTINVGPMFSGKTTALQQQGIKHLKANQNIVFLKPWFDNRYSENKIVSHDGVEVEAINVDNTLLIEEALSADVILVDEIQFMPESITDDLWQLISQGKTIYCSGLDMDYLGNGFKTTMKIMAIADEVIKYTAICKRCSKEATMSCKTTNNKEVIELGAGDSYFPACKSCYFEYNKERKGD